MVDRRAILLTGAAGRVGSLIAPFLRTAFLLRKLDVVRQTPVADDEIVRADVRDLAALTRACDGVAAVVHLAAEPDEADFRTRLLPRNVDATWSVFEAARRAGAPRVVFASSVQVVSAYPVDVRVTPEMPPRPVSIYAATKLFGEALGRHYADASGIGVACLRVGAVGERDDRRHATDDLFPTYWCAAEDLGRLVIAAVESDVAYATVFAVSPPATERFDVSNPFGWSPAVTPAMSAGADVD